MIRPAEGGTRRQVLVPEAERRRADEHRLAAAIGVDGMFFLAGQIGVLADGTLPPDPGEQFAQAFRNVDAILLEIGSGPMHVVDMTTYHVGLPENLESFSATRARWLGDAVTAWTAVGVVALARVDALVEIKVTALGNAIGTDQAQRP